MKNIDREVKKIAEGDAWLDTDEVVEVEVKLPLKVTRVRRDTSPPDSPALNTPHATRSPESPGASAITSPETCNLKPETS